MNPVHGDIRQEGANYTALWYTAGSGIEYLGFYVSCYKPFLYQTSAGDVAQALERKVMAYVIECSLDIRI